MYVQVLKEQKVLKKYDNITSIMECFCSVESFKIKILVV